MKTTIQLQYPVQDPHGIQIKELKMRRLKVLDRLFMEELEKAGKSDTEKDIKLFATLCEVEEATIQELDFSDFEKVQKAFIDFLPKTKTQEA